jgi:hypothetical protein
LPDIFQAALSNNLEMLDFLLDFEELPEIKYINLDIINDISSEMFILLLNSFKIQKDSAANILIEHNNLINLITLFDFFDQKLIIDGDSIAKAQIKGFLEIVAWCEDQGFFPDVENFQMKVSPNKEYITSFQSPNNRSTTSVSSPAYREARRNPYGYPSALSPPYLRNK